MNAAAARELHLLLDGDGALIVFQEKGSSWAGVLAFTSEDKARDFLAVSHLEASEIASIDGDDAENVAALVGSVKRRAVRYLLLDLDYRTGHCIQVEFEGDKLGHERERHLSPRPHE
ncbi:MAG TPA: hypothetical protein VMD75_08680 [Candidatus Binataceae bacterium]|nr:hypothetical protein [Candidatus Binataceae bacterium]